jgi:hypothetical protein
MTRANTAQRLGDLRQCRQRDRGAGRGRGHRTAAAAAAFLLLAGWVVLYLRISAPINRTLTAAADAHQTPSDARALQRRLGPNHRPQSRSAGPRSRRAVHKPDRLTPSTHAANRQSERLLAITDQLRIYTLRTAEALEDYATTRWPSHIRVNQQETTRRAVFRAGAAALRVVLTRLTYRRLYV